MADCVAWMDCQVYETKSTGDRLYFWADVVAAGRISDGPPLAEREVIQQAGTERLGLLKVARQADIEAQRPLRRAYREGLA